MSKHRIDQPYRSFQHFQCAHGITHPPKEEWRLTPYAWIGQINGLATCRGKLVATDGILCYIEPEVGPPMLCHIESFVPDDVEVSASAICKATRRGQSPSLKEDELNALLDEYK